MSRLDSLIESTAEDYRVLTVKVSKELAEGLKDKAKSLGISRTKLVNELFFAGFEEFEKKTTEK